MNGWDFETVVGHLDARNQFTQAAASGRLHHAWLLQGPQGIGKAALARYLAGGFVTGIFGEPAHNIFGEASSPALPPDHPQLRLLAQNAHPDVLVLERPTDEKTGKRKAEIPVDMVREAVAFARKTPALSQSRIVIVDAVDDLNFNAANALLKVLEEPPAGMVLLLVNHVAGRVLPTVRSRCRVVRLRPLEKKDFMTLAGRLAPDAPPEQVETLYQETGGRFGAALPFLAGEEDVYATARHTLGTLPQAALSQILKLAEQAQGATPEKQAFRTWLSGQILHRLQTRIRQQAIEGADHATIERLMAQYDDLKAQLAAMERLTLEPKAVMLGVLSGLRVTG